jgi:hypothetical protein
MQKNVPQSAMCFDAGMSEICTLSGRWDLGCVRSRTEFEFQSMVFVACPRKNVELKLLLTCASVVYLTTLSVTRIVIIIIIII